ncbi:MAG: hypothetical protein ACYS9X_29580, partial [Planctomycetota bacterium]
MRAMLYLLPALVLGLTDAPAQGGPGELTPPPPPPSPRPAPAPANPAAPAKLPVPSLDERKQAEKLIRDLFKDEYAKRTVAGRQDLATKLLASARGTKDDPAGLYVLLTEAAELAATAGDIKTAVAAVALQTRRFDVDAAKLQAETLDRARRAVRTPEAARDLAGAYVASAEEARIGDDYDGALDLLKKAESVARSARDAAVLADIQGQAREIRDLQKERRKVRPSLAKLEKDPDDPGANLAVGRYWCLYRGLWDRGLPHLAKGSDARLRELAGLEQEGPADPAGQQALGEAWWEAAQKESSRAAKGRLLARALHWYETALPALKGLARLRVTGRINTCLEQARFGLRIAFVPEKSMKLYPIGHKNMKFPVMETDDATAPFKGKAIYFDQRT